MARSLAHQYDFPTFSLVVPTNPDTVRAMSERDRYEPGVPCWVTAMQPDVDAAAAYYGGLFGWDYEDAGGFLTAKLHGRDVASVAPLAPGFDPPPAPDWITHVSVASAEEAVE